VIVGNKTYAGKITEIGMPSAQESSKAAYRLQVEFNTTTGDNFIAGQAATIRLR